MLQAVAAALSAAVSAVELVAAIAIAAVVVANGIDHILGIVRRIGGKQ